MAPSSLTIQLDSTLRRRVEIAARDRDTSVREWVEEAVRRELDREATNDDAITRISVPSFNRDWNSDEDAVYDELAH